MADRSLSGLPKFITEGLLGNLLTTTPPTVPGKVPIPAGISRGFDLFVLSVRKSRNKYEEKQTVLREIQQLKSLISQPDINNVQRKDYVCRMMYCHTLNYDVTFGAITALNLVSTSQLMEKRIGYLGCTTILHRDHELALMIISTMQSDMVNSNILNNMMGLTGARELISIQCIPHVLSSVISLLKHSRELVRQKAVMCLHQFLILAPDLMEHNHTILQKTLYDKDPGVMAAAVHIIQYYIEKDVENSLQFGESLFSILKQITSTNMASMFRYENIPFPWLQIQILKCLTKLAVVHESVNKRFIPVLNEVLQTSSFKRDIALCILYECLQSIVTIKSPKYLLDEAAAHIGKFLQSTSPTLKYIGVKLLVMLVKVNPQYSINYQQLIVKSLENSDVNIQRKMHRLLYEISNDTNVGVVCTKLINQIKTSSDKYWKSEVITMVMNLVQRFEGNTQWCIDTMFIVLTYGDYVIGNKLLNQVFCFIEKAFVCKQTADNKHQKLLVTKCVSVLVDKKSTQNSIHVALWTLGKLCVLLKSMPDDKIISLVIEHLTNKSLSYNIHSCAVTMLQHFISNNVVDMVTMATRLKECLKSDMTIVIRQRLSVILEVCDKKIDLLNHDNDSIDLTLTFLDALVVEDLKNGGMPFVPEHLRGNNQELIQSKTLVTDTLSISQDDSANSRLRTESTTSSNKTTEESEHSIIIPIVKKVWGKQGRIDTSRNNIVEEENVATLKSAEETEQNQLATVLFGGFLDKENDNDENQSIFTKSSDSAGWKKLHSERTQSSSKSSSKHDTQTNSSNTHTAQSVIDDSSILTDKKLMDIEPAETNVTMETEDVNNLFSDTSQQNIDSNDSNSTGENSSTVSELDLDTALSNLIDSNLQSPRQTHLQSFGNIDDSSIPLAMGVTQGIDIKGTSMENVATGIKMENVAIGASTENVANDKSTENVYKGTSAEMNSLESHYLNMRLEPPELPSVDSSQSMYTDIADSMYSGCDLDILDDDSNHTLYTLDDDNGDDESLYYQPSAAANLIDKKS
ncbi:hypothetical protein ACF0H5_010298 [Mactra antiquata]